MKKIILFLVVFSIVLTLSFRIIAALDSPDLKSTIYLEKYTKEELDFFSEVGFRYNDRVSKWEKDITVSIKGNPMQSDVLLSNKNNLMSYPNLPISCFLHLISGYIKRLLISL